MQQGTQRPPGGPPTGGLGGPGGPPTGGLVGPEGPPTGGLGGPPTGGPGGPPTGGSGGPGLPLSGGPRGPLIGSSGGSGGPLIGSSGGPRGPLIGGVEGPGGPLIVGDVGGRSIGLNGPMERVQVLFYSGVCLTSLVLFPSLLGFYLLSPDVVSLHVCLLPPITAFFQALAVPVGGRCCSSSSSSSRNRNNSRSRCFFFRRHCTRCIRCTQQQDYRFKISVCAATVAPIIAITTIMLQVQ